MSAKKVLLIGCSIFMVLGLILFGLIVGWFIYVSQDVQGVAVAIEAPLDVAIGETFPCVVKVTNERPKKTLNLTDIDVAEAYLAGFVIVSIEPQPKTTTHIPVTETLSHTFNHPVPAGQTARFTFELRAERAGIFRGDVDVCEGARCITVTAQTVVKEPAAP